MKKLREFIKRKPMLFVGIVAVVVIILIVIGSQLYGTYVLGL